jgi:chemotaxis protein MotB
MSSWQEREEELESQLNRGALWAITYGDMMSYLMIFFMILYVGAASRSLKMQMNSKSIEEHFGKKGTVASELFSQRGIQKIAKLEIGENKIRIVFQAPVLFDSGSANLKTGSVAGLKKLAQALKELPNNIQIEGHTDNQPLGPHSHFASNWELSAARAFAVLRFLGSAGIASSRLSAIGYGEFRPVAPNTTEAGRAMNRRIEIDILRREK